MVTIPGFLLRRLYINQSLRNNPEGFEFQLKNSLGSGYAYQVLPLTLDNAKIPMRSTYFVLKGRKTCFSNVTKENTFTLPMNMTITIRVTNVTLKPGPHKIDMGFTVPGLGTLKFDFTDMLADE